jgi:hypothetical protein
MRKTAYLIAAIISVAMLALLSLSPVAANASTSAPTAHRTTAATLSAAPVVAHQHVAAPLTDTVLPAKAAAAATGPNGTNTQGCTYNSQDNPYCQYEVDGPRQACGGYNGWIYWFDDDLGLDYIGTYGDLWSLCGVTAAVYLSWQQGGGMFTYDPLAGTASAYSTSGVNYFYPQGPGPFGGPSSVGVTVCTTEHGWSCGPKKYV